MRNKLIWSVAIFGFLFAITFCSSNYSGRFLMRNSSNSPNSGDVTSTPIPVPDGSNPNLKYFGISNSWTQINRSEQIAANIIFVLDRSHSMENKTQALKDSLTGWLSQLEAQGLPNFCIGLLSAVDSAYSGVIQGANGHKCFCRDQMGISLIKSNFSDAIDAAVGTTGSASSEDSLYSLYKAITDKLDDNRAGDECFRDDQAVVAFVMSDEQDAITAAADGVGNPDCAGKTGVTQNGTHVAMTTVAFKNSFSKYGSGGFQSTDASASNYNAPDDCYEAIERLKFANYNSSIGKYVNTFTPSTLTSRMIDLNGILPTYGNAIGYLVGQNPNFGANISEGPFHGGFEFADILNQDPIDIALASTATQNQFNSKMDEIASNLTTSLSYLYRFDLSDQICSTELNSLVVKVNGTTLSHNDYVLNGDKNKVTILPSIVFADGDNVKITFIKCTY